ncbi:unnamed protein product [Amaranthus hypochondriacus]
MGSNKLVAVFLMSMVVAAAMNMAVEAGDPHGSGSDVYKRCFEACMKTCNGGETRCEMSCDDRCDNEELQVKLNAVGKKLIH